MALPELRKPIDIAERKGHFEARFPMEMGILRLGGVYPGEMRSGEQAKNPYTGKPDTDASGRIEYLGNVGEHCLAVATAAERIATKVLGEGNPEIHGIVGRALVHDATKGYEIMRRKAGVETYTESAYSKLKPLLEDQGVSDEIAEYMVDAGSETGHNSLKNFVTLRNGRPVLNTERSLSEMIVHLADDMTYTPIVHEGEEARTTYMVVDDRMEASDFRVRYPFLYKEGFGFDQNGEVVVVKDVENVDIPLQYVRTYADWQEWTAKSIAEHLVKRLYPSPAPLTEAAKYLEYVAVAGGELLHDNEIKIVNSAQAAVDHLTTDDAVQVTVHGEVYEDPILPDDIDYSADILATFRDENQAVEVGLAIGGTMERIKPFTRTDASGTRVRDFRRHEGYPQLERIKTARSRRDAEDQIRPEVDFMAEQIDFALYKQNAMAA